MKTAIVTLAIGDTYLRNFERFCRSSWAEYAAIHRFDLIVLSKPLDESPRARKRSAAWQKCLIASQPEVVPYDRIVWVDSDIAINPRSPNICDDVPEEKIGAVDEHATPSREEYRLCLEQLYAYWSRQGIPYVENLSATEYHTRFGLELDGEFNSVVQTGVLVLNPRCHRQLLEHVYHTYEDKGDAMWNYEMRPLSYEILSNGLEFWIHPKYNMPWQFIKQRYYPFLKRGLPRRVLEKLGLRLNGSLLSKCTTTAYLNNYFLHFAGGAMADMAYIDHRITSTFDL